MPPLKDFLLIAVEKGHKLPASQRILNAFPQLRSLAAGDGGGAILASGQSEDDVVFDGIGVFGDRLVRTAAEAKLVSGQGRGNYLLVRGDTGRIRIEIDPLGYYPLFYYLDAGVFCAGTRVASIEDLLEGLGRPLRRDLAVHGWFTVGVSGAFGLSGHRELKLLPRRTTVVIDDQGRASINSAPDVNLFYSSRPLPELIDAAADESSATFARSPGTPLIFGYAS